MSIGVTIAGMIAVALLGAIAVLSIAWFVAWRIVVRRENSCRCAGQIWGLCWCTE